MKYTITLEVEVDSLDDARQYCQGLHDTDTEILSAKVEEKPKVVEKPKGSSMDLYMLLVLYVGESEFPEVEVCWTEIDVENNHEGYLEACQKARAKHKDSVTPVEFREVVVPSRGLPEVFRVPRLGGGDARVVS